MEKYSYANESSMNNQLTLGYYSGVVHKKHVASYGESGAKNIHQNIVETYQQIQKKLESTNNKNVLLVGKVQSGKTSNLELLTALAFDNGYNVLVIYGGYDTSLLKQTTDRFRETFDAIGEISFDGKAPAIFHTSDNNTPIEGINHEIMDDLFDYNKPIIFVSMKRPAAMRKINKLLKNIDRSKLKAFIIDDEGDQASLNTAKDKIRDASATYKQIKEMKQLLGNPMYLSVTATPQANIFLNEWSELRPGSIHLIRPGFGYDGAVVYHLRENNIVELVESAELDYLWQGCMPQSLQDAIQYFIVASSIKCKRAGSNTKERYSDMIIHSYREVSQHNNIYTCVENYIKTLKDSFQNDDADVKSYCNEFKCCYDKYIDESVKKEVRFDDIKGELCRVIRKVNVILKNAIGKNTQGNEQLKWHKIYIGGDLLQRGLTFRNLVTTYFTRWATRGGNMDTNLQRARWFGYREKYIDLCKIFTTSEISQEFNALAEIEEDLWAQFEDVENELLEIDDILIRADNTRQSPTSKQRVDYKRITFKNRWIKQRFLVEDGAKIKLNNGIIEKLINSVSWEKTTAGSRVNKPTATYAHISSADLKTLINMIYETFDCEPFQKKALIDLLTEDCIPVILMDACKKARYRSLYPQTFRIKALQQGADSLDQSKITYDGDSSVLIDKAKINIQIYKIVPGYKRSTPIEDKMQYMFAIYLPKDKVYFSKGR